MTTTAVQSITNPLAPGAIWYSSWGYDQTNIDYYEVVRATDKTVWLQRIGSKTVETGFMTGDTEPNAEIKRGEVFRKKIHNYRGEPSVSLTSYSGAYPWDGKPKRSSWYA